MPKLHMDSTRNTRIPTRRAERRAPTPDKANNGPATVRAAAFTAPSEDEDPQVATPCVRNVLRADLADVFRTVFEGMRVRDGLPRQ